MCSLAAANSKAQGKRHSSVIRNAHCKIHSHHNVIFLEKLRFCREKIKLPEIFFRRLHFHNDQHSFWCGSRKILLRKIISSRNSSHSGSMAIRIHRGHNFQRISGSQCLINILFPEDTTIRHFLPISL